MIPVRKVRRGLIIIAIPLLVAFSLLGMKENHSPIANKEFMRELTMQLPMNAPYVVRDLHGSEILKLTALTEWKNEGHDTWCREFQQVVNNVTQNARICTGDKGKSFQTIAL